MGKRSTTKEFIKKAQQIHGDLYDYSVVDYTHAKSKVNIICKEHGVFNQIANKHLRGSGCKKCVYANITNNPNMVGGYSETIFKRNKNIALKQATLYLIKYKKLYKIGITTRTVKHRFGTKVKVIKLLNNITLLEAFRKEQKILKEYKEYKCRPEIWKAGGINEFLDISKEQVKNIIKKHYKIIGDI